MIFRSPVDFPWCIPNHFPSIGILTHVAIWPFFQIEEFDDFSNRRCFSGGGPNIASASGV